MEEVKKAYDVKSLVEKLKDQGIEVAEEAAKGAIESVIAWFEESAKLSKTPYDDMALIILPQIKDLALEQADKINPND